MKEASNVAAAVLSRLGMARSPFPPTPDAEHYFRTEALERDLAEVAHCLLARKGFVVITGEVGRGKTTFLRRLLVDVEAAGARTSLVLNTFLQGRELLAAVLRDFGLAPQGDAAADVASLDAFLLARWREGTPCVLLIDDAQNLAPESLELLRLLSNFESGQEKLLQIVLSGQPELEDTLARRDLRQLASRVVRHVRLSALDRTQTARYVDFRLRSVGADTVSISPRGLAALHRDSHGNPRRVHLIMDRCLYGLVARGETVVDAALVRRAAAEAGFATARRLPRQAWPIAAALALAGAAMAGVGLRASNVEPPRRLVAGKPVAGASSFEGCIRRIARDAARIDYIDVPPRHVTALRDRADLCTEVRAGRWLVARAVPPAEAAERPVHVVQRGLLAHGAFDAADLVADPLDGRDGPRTQRALQRFQHAHGLPTTGEADALTRLLLDATPASAALHPESSNGRG